MCLIRTSPAYWFDPSGFEDRVHPETIGLFHLLEVDGVVWVEGDWYAWQYQVVRPLSHVRAFGKGISELHLNIRFPDPIRCIPAIQGEEQGLTACLEGCYHPNLRWFGGVFYKC